MSPLASSIETPCVRVCRLDPALQLCVGCGRSLDEIALWMTLTQPERRRIMAQLPERLATLARPPLAAATA